MSHLLKHARLTVAWGLVLAVVAGGVSLILPKYYSASSEVLIISRSYAGVDPYTQARAAEKIGENLAKIMRTTDFYKKVMDSNAANLNRDYWQGLSERQARKRWSSDVRPGVAYGTSILQITVFAKTKAETLALSQAVTQTLTNRGWEYTGNDVSFKAVNDPLLSRWYARPNIVLNAILGLVAGALLNILWVVSYGKFRF